MELKNLLAKINYNFPLVEGIFACYVTNKGTQSCDKTFTRRL